MTEQERIDQLKCTVPKVQLTVKQKILEVVGWTCSAIAVIALVVGLVAVRQAANVSNCINNLLGDRNQVQAKDAQVHVDFAQALQSVLAAPKAQQAHEYALFVTTLNRYVSTLQTDQSYRDAHPLGTC